MRHTTISFFYSLSRTAFALALLLSGCARDPWGEPEAPDRGMLGGLRPTRGSGVSFAERLTDGVIAPEGDGWRTDKTTVFRRVSSFVEYDLGGRKTIRGVFLEGDNNDRYIVSVSDDGQTFRRIFVAEPVSRAGMRTRSTKRLDASGRFVRVHAEGGDGSFSIGEVALYERIPEVFPPELPDEVRDPIRDALETKLLVFALALIAFVWFARKGENLYSASLLALPLVAGFFAVRAVYQAWPVEEHTVALVRGLSAMVALCAVGRAYVLRERFPAHDGAVTSTLALSALVALLAFYNLGRPQFWNAGESRPTFIHNHDMRVYYPVAKYFRELRFDGVYAASLAALEDIDSPGSLNRMAGVEFRDMTTHEMTRVGEARGTIAEVQSRFSPERWAAFVTDMRYFRHSMGLNGYLGSMHDHGANATPVWFLSALAIFAWSPASEAVFLIGAAIDLSLLLIAFAAIGRTFGLRTMLLSIVFFGANDFYMFGSNWAGATLRHDWMAYLALGACALRSSRYALGGVLLALAAMIRAFPALALVGVALAAGWMLIQQRSALGRPLTRTERMGTLAPFFRVAGGATICALGLWLATSLVFGFDSWVIWLEKVALLSRDSHVNNISLRQLALWTRQAGISNAGAIVVGAASGVFYGLLVFLAARRARVDQGAVLGLFLLPVIFDPANYYSHVFFLLPLLVDERALRSDRRGVLLWIAALAMCVSSFFTVDLELSAHFRFESLVLFGGLLAILAVRLTQTSAVSRAPTRSTNTPAAAA